MFLAGTQQQPENSHYPMSSGVESNRLCSTILPVSCPYDTVQLSKSTFKIATFNALFDIGNQKTRSYSQVRYRKQMEIFKRLDADVLCLNEVTQRLFAQLMNDQWIKDNYFMFMDDAICQNEEFFSNIMLCKHKPEVAFYLNWSHPELTFRPGIVLVIHVPASDMRLGIVGAHFKAFNSMSDARRTQFEESFALLDSLPVTYGCNELFLIGDLNIHQAFEESFIRSDAIDLWKHMNGESDKGYTFDGELNGTIQLTGGGTAWKSRYDRIIRMKKQDNVLGLTSIQLFAQERLFSDENDPELPDKKALILTASDHFGLVLECTTDQSGQVWPEPPKEVLIHAPPPPAPPVFMPMSQTPVVEQHVNRPMYQ